ncbi:MAG: isocitrate/isopropylmalate dehydrogenase family protein [Acidobacteria bacterium]|nr:isocitrate/isopropylmalate dehydrogenase family protein [Acidobacteriota bacterium]
MPFEIAVLPGDGIGPDVIGEAVRVLDAAAPGLLRLTEHAAGAAEYLRSGSPLPEATLAACRSADAILLGAMGIPHVRWPDGTEMTPQIDLREILDLYSGVRPCKLYHAADTPLKNYAAGSIDLVLVRENTEGLFFGRKEPRRLDAPEVRDVMRISRAAAERVCRSAFEIARRRRKKLTLVDKANVLPSMAYLRSIFMEIGRSYPDVAAECVYVDAMALYLVQRPERYDVLVTENMFGDILSDLAAGIVGGMGMAPSADIGDRHAVFQPSHGSAPDIAGQGIANPVATILSAALMLDWLPSPETKAAARRIEAAVEAVLADPAHRTPDLGGKLTTQQMGDQVLARL